MEEDFAPAEDRGRHGMFAAVDEEGGGLRGVVNGAGDGKGAGEDGTGFEAGFAHDGLVFAQDFVGDGDGEDLELARALAHDLVADLGGVRREGEELAEAEADNGESLFSVRGEGVEVEQKDADGGVGDDEGDIFELADLERGDG